MRGRLREVRGVDPIEATNIWLRHMQDMLYSPSGLGQPAEVNMYFSLVRGGLKCPSRMTALHLSNDPSCSFCVYTQGTFAHRWYACPGMLSIATLRFFPKRRRPGNLMKPTCPCFGPKCAPAFGARASCAGGGQLGDAG